jgi:hypothetical protein
MNVIIDEGALERARRATGEKTFSGVINRALREVTRIEILRDGIDRLDQSAWWPGYVEEFGPNPPLPVKDRKRIRRAALDVRAPRTKS